MTLNKTDLKLYLVTDSSWTKGQTLEAQVEAALRGGVTFLQYRDKHKADEAFIAEAKGIQALAKAYRVPFVINDHVAAAVALDADGVHVGQSDLNAKAVRQAIGPNKLLGVSAQTLEQALLAEAEGADYIGVGAVFNTSTKNDASEVSHETLKAICETVSIPVVAIGGIHEGNVALLANTGIDGVAVVSALLAADDIEEAAKRLASLMEG